MKNNSKLKLSNYFITFLLGLIIGSFSVISFQKYNIYKQQKSRNLIESEVKEVTNILINYWDNHSDLKNFNPPQVIPVLLGSRIQGACGTSESDIGNWDIGGSSYCGLTNTIYMVPEELKIFKKVFGITTIGFVVAHEFAHAVQDVYKIDLPGPSHELQADCIAGMLLKTFKNKLDISREKVLDLTELAYALGDFSPETHGTGEQCKYALLSGMGLIPSSCASSRMQVLKEGVVSDKYMKELIKSQSAWNLIDIDKTPFPKSLNQEITL